MWLYSYLTVLIAKKMKVKQLSREIEYTDDFNWYVQHKLECPMS